MSNKTKLDPTITVNPEAAERYNELQDIVYAKHNTERKLGNGKTVNLLAFWNSIKKNLEGLDNEEVEQLHRDYKEIKDQMREMGQCKIKSFKLQGAKSGKDKGRTHLLEVVKAEVLEWFGKLYSEEEIQKKLAEKGLPVHIGTIQRFRHIHKTEIEKLQHEYEMDWRSVSISRKRSRLDQLSYIYNKNKQEFDQSHGTKQLPFSKELRAVLEQVRKEVEGDLVKLTIDGKLDITTTIEINKSTEELYSSINFMSLLIGRISARFSINPTVLHYQLMNSWYSEFTGVKRNDKMKELKPNYPSAIVYNWDKIRDNYEKKEQRYQQISERGEIQDVEIIEEAKEKKATLKEMMLEKLKGLENSKEKL